MEIVLDPQIWLAFITLTALEIVLGIDNIIFITILVGRLPKQQQALARNLGLGAAMVTRIALLFSIAWIMGLNQTLFAIIDYPVSGRDLILFAGGAFLIAKSTLEIHNSLEGYEQSAGDVVKSGFWGVIAQIAVIDIVFSLDSVITAVGLVDQVWIMVAAIIIAVLVMIIAAGAIGRFVDRHPTIKMLALSFLILIGVALVGEALGLHIPKGYIYFAMAFSVVVEMLNIQLRRKRRRRPIRLRHAIVSDRAE